MSYVTLENINLSYDGKTKILEDLNLTMEKGELVSLLGPSGCGKTTTLRIIAGLLDPNSGHFTVDNDDMTHVPVHKRNFGMVFQSYALFPHLTVFDNVAFGLKNQKLAKDVIETKVKAMLKVVGLEDFGDRFPKQMSGGQRQRVALARALVIDPKLLLFDEPLSNLDAKLRVTMRNEIKRIQQESGITAVFVTHDQEECFSISDKVAVMNKGVIEQFDTPEAIYKKPKTKFVAHFIGFENFFDLEQVAGQTFRCGAEQELQVLQEDLPNNYEGTIRPSDIRLATAADTANCLAATVQLRTFLGDSYQYQVTTAIGDLTVELPSDAIYEMGANMNLCLPADKIVLVEK